MAYSDFRDKIKLKQAEAELKYLENSDEAWDQIKGFFSDATHWLVIAIAALLIVAGVCIVKLVSSVHAPDVSDGVMYFGENGGAVTAGVSSPDGEPVEEFIDDSNTVRPIVSGDRKDGWYTFLLIGTDASSGSTDTLMVVTYNVHDQKLNLMSIPRDTMVNVSWDIKKINSVYAMSGMNGLRRHIAKLVGFAPDYYVKIDLNAFIEVVDLVGGVEVDVPIAMHYHDPAQNLNIDLDPGVQTLTGEQAMGLVRFRKSDRGADGRISGYDDTGRVQTQQAFLKAMFKKCLSIRNWTKITGYVEIFQKDVESDLTLGEMLWFARQAMDLGEDGFMTCTIPGNYYASAWSRSINQMQSYVTLYADQIIRLVNESFNPYLSRVTMANLDIMSINSDGSISSSTGYVADSRAAMPPVTEQPPQTPEPTEETPAEETAGETGQSAGETGQSAEPASETEQTPPDSAAAQPAEPPVETEQLADFLFPPETNVPDTTPTGETGGEQ